MADLFEVSRTKIICNGKLDSAALQKVFDEACAGRRASMMVSYDKQQTRVLLSPMLITDEVVKDNDGNDLNCRTRFQLDKGVMSETQKRLGSKNAFIDKVWMPYKKVQTQGNLVLPALFEKSDHIAFELLSCDTYQNESVRTASTSFRNRTMKAAKFYLAEYFARQAELCKASKPAARMLDEISMALADYVETVLA